MKKKKCITKIFGWGDNQTIEMQNHEFISQDTKIGTCTKCGVQIDNQFAKGVNENYVIGMDKKGNLFFPFDPKVN